MVDNQKRLFADVVTVDAWHAPFGAEASTADLRVDAVFDVGRVGGEAEAPIRFRLGLRRAEVVVVISPTEPIEVLRQSVARETVCNPSQLGPGGLPVRGATTGAQIQPPPASAPSEALPLIPEIGVIQSQDAEGNYRWKLSPRGGEILIGRGWDAPTSPRLTLRDTRKSLTHVGASVRIEVRCRREDIHIFDIQSKDEGMDDAIRSVHGFENRRAAAEAYIRSALSREKLRFNNFDDPFGEVCIADVIAQEGR
jgi:hypothetical protein